jgi:hypothetical protein
MANLNQLVFKVSMLPFHDKRCEVPAKVLPQTFISRSIIVLKTSNKTIRVIYGPASTYDCIIRNLMRHLKAFLLVVRNVRRFARNRHPRRYFALKVH